MSRRIRVAVVGLGQWGRHHARIYAGLPEAELAAVVDVNAGEMRAVAQRYRTAGYTDYRDVLGRVDAVSVVVPTHLHYEVARAFLESGAHVLVEKPMTGTLPEATALVDLARRTGRLLAVGHVERFKPAVRRLADLAREPLFIQARRVRPYDRSRTMDVGVVMDLMIHDIDIALALAGSRPVQLGGLAVRVHNSHEDLAVAHLTLASGCRVWLMASRVSAHKASEIEVVTPDRVVRLDYLRQRLSVHRFTGEVEEHEELHGEEPLRAELAHFVACVAGREQPLVTGEDGRQALEVALALLAQMTTVTAPVRV
ncbi:MAG: Gfo/Idh/MocA family oxidoreductase [Armatimonadota bacterium]|nr:Gfo/Idh/MocA family oxidoreductase [Armatimonadota bacterium]MDR7400681.1 Gfo/Idh/MocA family oxidoreductase [Armatimonadota bacterium]MDR7403614.1 Gfo/Idh/MocA family oxidoreductase [Armatimonadota bacterium]MDR7436508.1 Gfo/Idh/MocA family oxidoreductase [Armatimonadota bacterium]MDR7472543.1 Gfo/Idh/MocA family oxidoreductase [Armatimonadota bacterium]